MAAVSADNPAATSDPHSSVSDHEAKFHHLLGELFAALDTGDPELWRNSLQELTTHLQAMPRDDAIRLSMTFLQSGEDRAIPGRRFAVGQGSLLKENPSVRVFFMDQLGQLCKAERRPEADQIARGVLAAKDSVDEWAISLRNVAWFDPDGSRPFVGEKSLELIRHQPWLEKPSNALYEALDGLIYGRQLEALEDLNQFLDLSEDDQLHHAGQVSFSRMADEVPAELAETLNQTPSLLSEKPELRADLFAKMDIAVPEQLRQLEAYLSRTDLSTEEKSRAVKGLLSPKLYKFFGLLNEPTPITESQEGARQRWDRIDAVIHQWEEKGQFPELFEAFGAVTTSVANGYLHDEIARMRDRYYADYMTKNPGVEMRQVPPMVFRRPSTEKEPTVPPKPLMPFGPSPSDTR